MATLTDLATLLRSLQPVLHTGTYAYVQCPEPNAVAASDTGASVRAAEGLSLVVEASAPRGTVCSCNGAAPGSPCLWHRTCRPSA